MSHKKVRIMTIVLILMATQLGSSPTARAVTYTVTNTNDSGPGSLRQAIIDANLPISIPPHLIQFNIDASTDPGCDAGTGVCTIQPASALPAVTGGGITIDGYTQTGAAQATATASATLKIVIDGTNAGESANGLDASSANNVIKGLVINRFSKDGIEISGSGATGNVISGNHIGTDVSGTAASGNGWRGVDIRDGAQNNTVGGDTPGDRNVISDNGSGVYIWDGNGNTVSGNYIGTNGSGTGGLGNAVGVYIGGAQNNSVEGNVIGNGELGVCISDGDGNTVSDNYIGTDVGGTADLGNTQYGVRIYGDAQNNTIGPNNIIAHSGYDGVEVRDGTTSGNVVTQNSIFSNTVLGIDLRSGGNGDIAAPVIAADEESVPGSVDATGTACAACTVELFANGDGDGEGETFVGDTVADGSGAFKVTVPVASVSAKFYLTATATDVVSGTSRFSSVYLYLPHDIYLPLVVSDF